MQNFGAATSDVQKEALDAIASGKVTSRETLDDWLRKFSLSFLIQILHLFSCLTLKKIDLSFTQSKGGRARRR